VAAVKCGILSAVQLALPLDSEPGTFERGTTEPRTANTNPEPGTWNPELPGSFRFIRHKRARRYLIRVDPDGHVRVTIPRGGSKREAEAFAKKNLRWIADQRARLTAPMFSVEERRALRARAEIELPPRLLQLAAANGLTVARVSIRNQRTRWGSCGRDGHICLNWRLLLMPEPVRDYVLIHELMHLRRMDHSPAYWAHVAAACPGYRAARQWLRTNGPGLR
jgi:predicted metal-dependent hydrolase